MVRTEVEGFAAGAGDVPQRQQNFGGRQVFARAPIDSRSLRMTRDESFSQDGLAGARLGRDGNNPPPTFARLGKGLS